MIFPPLLETERLLLKAHAPDVFEPLSAMWSDPAVVRHIGGKPSTRRESWMRMLSYAGCWSMRGFGYWAIWDKQQERYAGDVGFADFHREIEPPIFGLPEAGWALAPWAQGRGRATEALTAALSWLDEQEPEGRSVCLIAPENLSSIRIAQKVGFRDPVTKTINDRAVLLFSRLGRAGQDRHRTKAGFA